VVKLWLHIALPAMIVPILVVATRVDPTIPISPRVDNFALIENQLLSSSRYTQVDDLDNAANALFNAQYQLRYTEAQLAVLGFENMLENDRFRLYFEKDSYSLILEHKPSGYMMSSRPEFQGYSQTREDNRGNRNLMNSGLWVEWVRTNSVSNSAIRTESLYTIADVDYVNTGSQNLADIDWTSPYILVPNRYDSQKVSVSIASKTATAFNTIVQLPIYGFSFQVEIRLSNQGFIVHFDPSQVVETNPIYRLLSVQFFPYFGSTREDVFPGYMVIPDGVGALVRTNRRYDTNFQADYYGSDLGYLRSTVTDLSLPLYGLIHQPNRYGFFTEITEGAEHASLLANFWGRNTRYQRITNRYHLRRIYRSVINRAGDGRDVINEEMNLKNYTAHYQFLYNQEANYVGLAKQYQQNLVAREQLKFNQPNTTPLHLAMLMYEQEPTIFGTSRITMTSMQAGEGISQSLREQGIDSQMLVLKGWSRDGYAYRQPYQWIHPDRAGLNALVSYATDHDTPLYLEQDYLVSSELSQRIRFNQDVSRNFSKLKMRYPLRRLDNQPIDEYYVYPQVAEAKFNLDRPAIDGLGITGLAMPHQGRTLFSYYNEARFSRSTTLEILLRMQAELPSGAFHRPNAYVFPYMNQYLDMAVTNSQLDIFTDLVPLIPLVMKGYVPMYTPYLNFNALGKERLLQMIDFGINPAYILTDEPSSKLQYTYSNRYFTTAYSDFKDDMVSVYQWVANALDPVIHATVETRDILATGVSRIQYDNGVTIYINYRSDATQFDGLVIPGLDYLVINV
jgi:hypothetical protein